jgi:YfiR/HmsC-like
MGLRYRSRRTTPFSPGTRKRSVRMACVACVLFALSIVCPAAIAAQEMEVPVAVQVPLFLKVMTFDRQRRHGPDVEVLIGITYQSGYRTSVTTRDEVTRALAKAPNLKYRLILIDLDRDDLVEMLQHHRVNFLYVSPLRAISASSIAAIATAAHVTSVTGVPQYVEQGIAVGARLRGDRPRLMVNLASSKQSGADFTSELLKLAEVLP